MSGELVARLSAYPKMRSALERLPPKMLAVCTGQPTARIDVDVALDGRVERAIARIRSATFTGKGDSEMVPMLYTSYVEKIARVLQQTLGIVAVSNDAEADAALSLLPMPLLDVPRAPPLRLAEGQLMLLTTDAPGRLAGGEGSTHLGRVAIDGRSVTRLLALNAGARELAFDACSQAVLPWRPTVRGWTDGLPTRLRAVVERTQSLTGTEGEGVLEQQMQAIVAEVDSVSGEVLSTSGWSGGEHPCLSEVRPAKEALAKSRRTEAERADQLAVCLGELRSSIPLAMEMLAAHALRATGAAGARRYATSQALTVRRSGGGGWTDALVVDFDVDEQSHRLRFGSGDEEVLLRLHPWNHGPRELAIASFETLRHWWVQSLQNRHEYLVDALSGVRLNIRSQLVPIEVTTREHGQPLPGDADSVSKWLHALYAWRRRGTEEDSSTATLLTAGPAAGKTSLLSQVIMRSLDGELVPILIKTQLLQQHLLKEENRSMFGASWNWIDAFLRIEHGDTPLYRMLRQAMMTRRALLLIDGLDEGGQVREQIERHVAEVVVPQGHVLLATSRPAGVSEERYKDFHRLRLSALSEEQQQQAVERRLGERAAELLPYLREKIPLDGDTQTRITGNPLMLSMVISVYELRQGIAMPATASELYSVATRAMLDQAGASEELVRALSALFCAAHTKQQRIITEEHLQEAAQALDGADGLSTLRARALQDRMPLLSVLQAEPLQMQAAHLSLQEFFVAQAICEGRGQLKLPIEHVGSSGAIHRVKLSFGVWWSNTAKLCSEMGDGFGRSLLRAAGIEGDAPELKLELRGDRPTDLVMVQALMAVSTSME